MSDVYGSMMSGASAGAQGGATASGSLFGGLSLNLSTAGVNSIASGISDFFTASADRSRAEGDRLEEANYDLAAAFADKNVVYTQWSTEIKEAQESRVIAQTESAQKSEVASAGMAESGSALDVMRDTAQQGALQKAVTQEQGLITQEGYQEQADSYRNMSKAAGVAASAADNAATGADITGAIKTVAGIAAMVALV